MKKLYWLETYGCQMNKAESTGFELELHNSGWVPASSPESADLVLLNTCSVRTTAENRIWGRIGFYKAQKKKRNFRLAVVGCMAERLKEAIQEKEPAVDYVVGTFEKKIFFDSLEKTLPPIHAVKDHEDFSFAKGYNTTSSFQSLVPIMHGCNNFCTYCIVPYVRGKETSRDPDAIRHELSILQKNNVREITLLGQNVNSYCFSQGEHALHFPALLQSIAEDFRDISWIRFLTSHPKDFSRQLVDVIGKYPNICRHIHLPVQHGSNRILKSMNRKYTREEYIELVSYIRANIPGVSLSTDILVGFPGETEEDFLRTCDLMNKVEFQDAFTYYFNPIEGTEAYSMTDSVPKEEKLKRLSKIIELQHNISEHVHRRNVGTIVTVLAESFSRKNREEILARTERNEMVVFPGSEQKIGNFTSVKITEYVGNTYRGVEVQ